MLTETQTSAVRQLAEEVEELQERLEGVARLGAEELDYFLDLYNWDDGFEVPTAIAAHPDCDQALALRLFWLADGLTWYTRAVPPGPYQQDWAAFCQMIIEGLLSGRFPHSVLSFDPGLSRVELYRLRKAEVPEVLYQPVAGKPRP